MRTVQKSSSGLVHVWAGADVQSVTNVVSSAAKVKFISRACFEKYSKQSLSSKKNNKTYGPSHSLIINSQIPRYSYVV